MTEQVETGRRGVWRSIWRNLAALVLCLVCYYLAPIRAGDSAGLSLIGFVTALGALTWLIIREIRRLVFSSLATRLAPLMVAVYLTLVLFAAAYYKLADWPNQMSGLETKTDALYFTLVTLATVGFGDIVPVGQPARVVAMIQIMFNLVIIASVASIIGWQLRERMARRRDHAG